MLYSDTGIRENLRPWLALGAAAYGLWMVATELDLSYRGTVTTARVAGFHVSGGRHRDSYPQLEFGSPPNTRICTTLSSTWFWTKPHVGDRVSALISTRDGLQCEMDSAVDRWLSPALLTLGGIAMFVAARPRKIEPG